MMSLSCTVVVLSLLGATISAFGPSSLRRRVQHHSSSRLYSSTPEDDEISRLIGRRSEIKRKKNYSPEDTPESLEFDISEEDISWDEMPEFTTQRPVRKPKKSSDSQKKKEKEEDSAPTLDFTADYEDENEFHIPNRIGFTTIAWGDAKRGFVSGGKLTKKMRREGKFVPGDLQVAYNTLLEGGVSFVETSESYGSSSRSSSLSAEDILARCVEEQKTDNQALVATTFSNKFPSLKLGAGAVVRAAEASCNRMDTSGIELYQIQSTFPYIGGRRALAEGLAQAVDKGYCNYVGACNLGKGGVKGFSKKLEQRGLSLTSNQFEFSLTNRKKEGLIDACKEQGVIPLIRNPLDDGLASGKYTATNPSGGQAGGTAKFPFSQLEKLQPLHSVHETVAERASTRVGREVRDMQERYRGRYGGGPKINTDISTTQVAINYVIAKGGVPLVEVTDSQQAEEVLGCLGWSLTEDEVDMLDSAASLCGL